MSSLLRLEQQQKGLLNLFWIRMFLLLFYSFGIETINTFIHFRSCSKTIPDPRPKWVKSIPVFRAKRRKNRIVWSGTCLYRLRVVPHFSSGIVERAKRERAWKLPHARKGDTRLGKRKSLPAACRRFSRWVIFTRARVSLAQLSLRKNGALLVV